MPVVVDPDNQTLTALLEVMPSGTHAVAGVERMGAWLDLHGEEYVAVLGQHVPLVDALAACENLRLTRPTLSVVLVVEAVDTDVLTRAMKAGARDVVRADDAPALRSAVQQALLLHTALRGPGSRTRGRVVTVFSPKGGVGKTTVAVNLALALTDRGAHRVCLVDLDLAFGDVAITMQLFPTHSIEHAIGAEDSLDLPALESLLTRHQDSLMVLAAPAHPDTRERIVAALVGRVLGTLTEGFDYVVVDTAPAFDDQVLAALDETDDIVLVATLDVPTLKNVKVALETLDALDIARGHRHLLLNRADDAVGISSDKVEAILGMPVSAQLPSSIDVAAATNSGVPIVAEKPSHPTSLAFLALASRLGGRPTDLGTTDLRAEESSSDRVRSMFRRRRTGTPTAGAPTDRDAEVTRLQTGER